jgi:hypothetical protein
MQFLKKHYEKIILSVVLLGLAVASFMLVVEVQSVREKIEQQSQTRQRQQKKQIPPVSLEAGENAVQRLSKPLTLKFAGADHNLANPVPWGRDKSSNLFKITLGNGTGPNGLRIRQIIPLNLVVAYEEIAGKGDELRYKFGISKEYAKQVNARRRNTLSATVGGKTTDGTLVLREVKGPKEDPTELVCELLEGGETFTVTKDKPFIKTLGYAVELHYKIEKRDIPAKRVDETVALSGSNYKIVAISKDEVVISDPDSKKRFPIRTVSAP